MKTPRKDKLKPPPAALAGKSADYIKSYMAGWNRVKEGRANAK